MKSLQQRNDSPCIRDIDIVKFLIKVFPSWSDIDDESPIKRAFTSLSKTSGDVFFQWLYSYRQFELEVLLTDSSQNSMFDIVSQSRVRNLLYHLLEEGSTFMINDE